MEISNCISILVIKTKTKTTISKKKLIKSKNITINRKVLSNMAVNDPEGFSAIIKSIS